MMEKQQFSTYDYESNLKSGDELIIKRSIYPQTNLLSEEMLKLDIDSLLKEKKEEELAVFEKLKKESDAWIEKAKEILVLKAAKEYLNTPEAKTTHNKWKNVTDDATSQEIRNHTYRMYIHIYEKTKYDKQSGQQVPVSWEITWYVMTNSPRNNDIQIAGQDRKKFTTSKEKALAYIEGRKKAYAEYFTEEYPVIPAEYKKYFSFSGMLLPGYKEEV